MLYVWCTMEAMRIVLTVLGVLLALGLTLFLLLNRPSNDRAWLPEYAKVASAEITPTKVTIKNVRDWTYDTEVLSEDWTEVTVDPRTITRAWFVIEPFGGMEGVGHTFLSFEFTDGTALSFSIQARQEASEDYSAFKGLANAYELAYQWGTERDFFARRLLFLEHDLRMYPLAITSEDAGRLFMSVLEETNEVAKQPRFYNTLTANCTNMLAKIVNEHYPNRLPYDLSWNLTGYSDLYLMDEGLIELHETLEQTRATGDLTPHREQIHALATRPANEFSEGVRALLTP